MWQQTGIVRIPFYFLFQLQKDDKVHFFVALDEIPEDFVSDSTVYFLRDTNGMCPTQIPIHSSSVFCSGSS